MPDDRLDIEWDSTLDCWLFGYMGEWICLGAQSRQEAIQEARQIMEEWT